MSKVNRIITDKNSFTKVLNHIANAPKELHCIGKLPDTRRPSIAIVGTRKPTNYGIEVTSQLAGELASRGIVIVSGLAFGVDALAHRAALEVGGTTIAILASGVNDITPRTNQSLGEQIIKSGGAIMSEYEPDEPAYASRFIERNRIVSGLADAVLITEATERSGTMTTAAFALEQGKDVFVVPGPINSPHSAGCNKLLKQGAHPVTCVQDILQIIAPDLLELQGTLSLGANPLETRILELISGGLRDGDEILKQSGATPSEFNTALTMLELADSIRGLGANQWARR